MKSFLLASFFAVLLCPVSAKAQSDLGTDASQFISGKAMRRMTVSPEVLNPVRRLAPARRGAPAQWSFPSAMPTSPFAGGSGTDADPYRIATAQQLANLSYLVRNNSSYRSKSYVLLNDIILNEELLNEDRSLKAVGTEWKPIGTASAPFTGHFNGNGHSVKGIYIHTSGEFTGLFGYVCNATIEDLGVEDGYIYGCCRTGGVTGYAENAVLRRCFNTNTLYSKSSLLGGIVGHTSGATQVEDCMNAGFIYCYGQYCGNHGRNGNCVSGIAGAMDSGASISYCYNTGAVYGGAYFSAGICNAHNGSGITVTSCHNVGAVSCYDPSATGAVVAACGGYYFPVDPTCSKTYALEGSSPTHNWSTEKSPTQFADGTVLSLLDSNLSHFKQGQQFPILNFVEEKSVEEPEVILYQGQCGDNAYWRLTDQGELIISGTGAMFDYGELAITYIQKATPAIILAGMQRMGVNYALQLIKKAVEKDPSGMGLAPWVNYSNAILKVTVEEGITTIAQGAFLMLTNAAEITIPTTIEEVGTGAFAFCTGLTQLYCYAVEPPALTGVFSDYTFCYTANQNPLIYNAPTLCTLHVPTGSKALYAAAKGWNLFTNVQNDLRVEVLPLLALTDADNTLIPEAYRAGRITYSRSGDEVAEGAFASFCLPFDIDLEACECFSAVYAPLNFVTYSPQDKMISLSFVPLRGVVQAGTPFLALMNGKNVLLKSCTETTLTGYEDAAQTHLPVLDQTSTGGILQEDNDIELLWTGAFVAAPAEGINLFNTDGTMSAQEQTKPFRTHLTISSQGKEVKGIYAIVKGKAAALRRGDVNQDGKVSITDAVTIVNMILNKEAETKAMVPQ